MQSFELSTPALLFPAISLLLLAYTNRFLTLAKLIRDLHAEFNRTGESMLLEQIQNLGLRLKLIRAMQACGVLSLLVCVVAMFLILQDANAWALKGFQFSLILLALSLTLSVWEIQISSRALSLQISELGDKAPKHKG